MTFYHKRDDGKGGAVSFDLQRYNAKGDYQDGFRYHRAQGGVGKNNNHFRNRRKTGAFGH